MACCTYWNNKVILLRLFAHRERETVQKLVLEHTDWVRVTNGSFKQTLRVLGRVRCHNLQTGDRAVPCAVVLRVLGADTSGEAIGTAESDVTRLDTTGHVVGLCGGVNDLVDGLHGEVEGHELADGVEACKGGTNGEACKPGFRDGRVNNALLAEAVQETFGDLVAKGEESVSS